MNQKKNIVITTGLGLYPDQVERLGKLGTLTKYDDLPTPEQWLLRARGADIICTGIRGLKEKVYELENVFISLPFVGAGFLDREKLRQRNITVARSPGCNLDAVAEWAIGMMVNLLRRLPMFINAKDERRDRVFEPAIGLAGKTVCILGKGNIGSKVGRICEALDMDVRYFQRGDDLLATTRTADVVIDCLNLNPTTEHLLGQSFFRNLKRGSYFVTVTSDKIWDVPAMLQALDDGILAGVANDLGGSHFGDVADSLYKKLSSDPRVLATPHIAHNTDVTHRRCNDIMIDNVEAWLRGEPQNILT